MENIDMKITNTSDVELFNLEFNDALAGSATTERTLRLHNEDARNTTVNYVTACRADMLIAAPVSEDSDLSNVLGQELVTESWLEARAGTAGAWTALDGWTSKLDLGAILVGAYATFQVRLNIPAGATTLGTMAFCFGIRSF